MNSDRNRDTDRQGHRRMKTGKQTDKNRDTDRLGYRWTGAGTQRDRERDQGSIFRFENYI